jgi:hypothetical protein
MHLRAHVSTLIRVQSPNLIRGIVLGDPKTWPPHLQLAWAILKQLRLSDRKARIVLHNAGVAASDCSRSMIGRIRSTQNYEVSEKAKQAFHRLSHCTKRARAELQHLLDEKTNEVFADGDVDIEVIEALIKVSRAVFEQFGDDEPARTALKALRIYHDHEHDTIGLLLDFSSLSPLTQQSCTSALEEAVKGKTIQTAATFEILAKAISKSQPTLRGAADIVITYVATVAFEWRQSGLSPSRAVNFLNPAYVSPFHRFCDLVLTALLEPESRRHLPGLDDLSHQAWARQRQLPLEDRKAIRGGLPRKDSQWLVTAHCLREGLRQGDSKKRMRDSI